MASVVKVPIKYFPDGEPWLLLDSVLSKRIIFRAHEIDMKGSVKDLHSYLSPAIIKNFKYNE